MADVAFMIANLKPEYKTQEQIKMCIESLIEVITYFKKNRCQYQDNIFLRKLVYHYTEFTMYCEVKTDKILDLSEISKINKDTVEIL